MQIDNKFNLGQEVYIVTDVEQLKFMVVGFMVLPNNLIQYIVKNNESQYCLYDFELSDEVDIVFKISQN